MMYVMERIGACLFVLTGFWAAWMARNKQPGLAFRGMTFSGIVLGFFLYLNSVGHDWGDKSTISLFAVICSVIFFGSAIYAWFYNIRKN